jgi:hypothetical protein
VPLRRKIETFLVGIGVILLEIYERAAARGISTAAAVDALVDERLKQV